MKPRYQHDDDDQDVAVDAESAGSTVRAKRTRLAPGLDRIADAVRAGEISPEEAREQMLAAIASSPMMAAVPGPERIGILAAMRMLTHQRAAPPQREGEHDSDQDDNEDE